jgi:hypothetical protein
LSQSVDTANRNFITWCRTKQEILTQQKAPCRRNPFQELLFCSKFDNNSKLRTAIARSLCFVSIHSNRGRALLSSTAHWELYGLIFKGRRASMQARTPLCIYIGFKFNPKQPSALLRQSFHFYRSSDP